MSGAKEKNGLLKESYKDQLNEYHADINFQSEIEGQIIKTGLKLYSLRDQVFIDREEFVEKYVCVFHLAEIGCNECYIHEFDIIREVLKKKAKMQRIAVVTPTVQQEFIIKLIKDYAPEFDVYQIKDGFFEHEIKTDFPFFLQFSDSGVCYNVHKSSKITQELTSLYLKNLNKVLASQ